MYVKKNLNFRLIYIYVYKNVNEWFLKFVIYYV